ncbi:MAG: DapH/DapD/GlmU-related protein [Clostridia bacterium]|nr:DapH/DapD/GlmU-related protein [Clostridia bacterium]
MAVNHNFDNRVGNINTQGTTARGIIIEDDVWIGVNAVILDGVHIGKGAVIGAGAVVTKNIGSYCVAYGNPAKVHRQRGK